MATIKLLVEVSLEGDEISPMQLDDELAGELKWIKDGIMGNQYQHLGIIHVDWDEPKPAKLSIHIKEVKDG